MTKFVSPKPSVQKEANPIYDDSAFQSFIERNLNQNKVFLQVTDMKEWRKRMRVEKGQKVFIIKGGYHDVRKAMLKRGWFEN